jgi:nucleoside-triphosphatase
MAEPIRILLEGRPGSGKTTVARRLVDRLRAAGLPVTGFTTEEIREGRQRVGFRVEAVGGTRATLAHVRLSGPPKVGKYGVDLRAFERIALPALDVRVPRAIVVIDELGKMELSSPSFREAVEALFDGEAVVIATVHVFSHPTTDALKARPDVEVLRVSERNRDALPSELARRLGAEEPRSSTARPAPPRESRIPSRSRRSS